MTMKGSAAAKSTDDDGFEDERRWLQRGGGSATAIANGPTSPVDFVMLKKSVCSA